MVENLDHLDDAQHLADRIEHALAQPFPLAARIAHIGGSIGIAGINDTDTGDTVLAYADKVMYRRKHHRKANTHTPSESPRIARPARTAQLQEQRP